jgi:hypothetical protein
MRFSVMPLSNPLNWKLNDDPINDSVWTNSPARQIELCGQYPVDAEGSVGGQQAMLLPQAGLPGDAENPVSWVPDLVGRESDKGRGVMVIGSAYAPFVENYTGRLHAIGEIHYRNCGNWSDFLSSPPNGFLQRVVYGDHAYYGKIEELFSDDDSFHWDRLILTDWCHASFVKRVANAMGNRRDTGGDSLAGANRLVFFDYVAQSRDWHTERLKHFSGKVVVLGNLAHECLRYHCLSEGWRIKYFTGFGHEPTEGWARSAKEFWHSDQIPDDFVVGKITMNSGKTLEFTVVAHPSARDGDRVPWVEINELTRFRNWIG